MKLSHITAESILATALPEKARWMIDGAPLDFEFTVASHGLQPLPNEVQRFGDATWSDLLVFGEHDYAEGGGARALLCIRERDGAVLGLDLEREVAIFPLNSSADKVRRNFSSAGRLPRSRQTLAARLREANSLDRSADRA